MGRRTYGTGTLGPNSLEPSQKQSSGVMTAQGNSFSKICKANAETGVKNRFEETLNWKVYTVALLVVLNFLVTHIVDHENVGERNGLGITEIP